ncbi:serine/arginine repetitive matrix protein 1-like isoform X2 [Pungitius pungitius]|uniref:serine/arginine repetitive matrix protein 1-like isoform X2 n=1 Tax=Pungitius pungitius TaxID=134920 RepID=UPI001886BEA9|nr:serine/arginine repetitive matrix protein 1-like isoform X2 [Pungitius pungitius]
MSNNNAIEGGANRKSKVVQTDDNRLKENLAETVQGDASSHGEKSSVEMSNNSPIKRGRGRPRGPKNLNKSNQVSGISISESKPPRRGRGRPKLQKATKLKGSGDDLAGETPTEVIQTDGNSEEEEEEEKKMAETGQGDVASHEEEPSVEESNSPVKSGRGRPQGFKMLKVSLTDIIKTEQVSGISTSESKLPRRGRGRPKLQKATELKAQEPINQSSDEDNLTADHFPKKRKSLSKSPSDNADAKDLPNGASDAPKAKRGRPKGSTKRKSGSSAMRRNPRRSSNKTPKLETEERSEEGEDAEKPPRGRGRPKKIKQETGDRPPAKKRPGRPKGSLNKKRPAHKVSELNRSPPKPWKRGRPKKTKAKRGRPRKYPLPSPKEIKKPRVWKPLGRPRKYPRVDPAEGSEPAPPRGRGRPHKTQSKKGAHLRKSLPESLPSPIDPNVEPPRKRGRPPKSEAVPKRKRGRPKGSVNSSKAGSGTPIECADANHSTAESDSPLVALKCEAEEVEIKEETPINQDADSEVKPQLK